MHSFYISFLHCIGWSNASSNLSNRLVMLRLRAELTTKFEKAIQACVVSLKEYQTHLSSRKLATPILLQVHDQWQGKEVQCILYNLSMGKSNKDTMYVSYM